MKLKEAMRKAKATGKTQRVTESAQATETKVRVSITIPCPDLEALRKLAAREGIPYQTLMGSVLHKYVTGQLVDVDAARLALEALVKKRA